MKRLHLAVAGLCALAAVAGAQTQTVGTSRATRIDLAVARTLVAQLDDAAEDLTKAILVQPSSERGERDSEFKGRLRNLNDSVHDLKKQLDGVSNSSETRDEEIDDLVRAYFSVMQAITWLDHSDAVAKKLPPVQSAVEDLVAMHGGWSRFDVPDYVKVGHTTDADSEDVDFKVNTTESETTVVHDDKDRTP